MGPKFSNIKIVLEKLLTYAQFLKTFLFNVLKCRRKIFTIYYYSVKKNSKSSIGRSRKIYTHSREEILLTLFGCFVLHVLF